MHPQAAGRIVNTERGRYAHPFDTCTTSNVRVSPSSVRSPSPIPTLDYFQFSIIITSLIISSSCGKSSHLPSLDTGSPPIHG